MNDTAAHIRNVLNRHGDGFHYAVMRRAEQQFSAGRSLWQLVGAEYPVELNGAATHIDFIYSRRVDDRLTLYLVGECKRVAVSRERWCFAKAPFTWFNPDDTELAFDRVRAQSNSYGVIHDRCFGYSTRPICRIGREFRPAPGTNAPPSDERDNKPNARDGSIGGAVTQALRGSGGLISALRGDPNRYSADTFTSCFFPAVFTTAELWLTSIDLSTARLADGTVPADLQAQKVDWLWFVHNRTPHLIPAPPVQSPGAGWSTDLRQRLRAESARAVAIVSPEGLDDFLRVQPENFVQMTS